MIDKYQGHGGSYVIDPKTGARKLVDRTDEAAPAALPEPKTVDETE